MRTSTPHPESAKGAAQLTTIIGESDQAATAVLTPIIAIAVAAASIAALWFAIEVLNAPAAAHQGWVHG